MQSIEEEREEGGRPQPTFLQELKLARSCFFRSSAAKSLDLAVMSALPISLSARASTIVVVVVVSERSKK